MDEMTLYSQGIIQNWGGKTSDYAKSGGARTENSWQVQWILDLVTINLVTILDLVTLLPLTRFLCSKMHRFSDNLANFIVLI